MGVPYNGNDDTALAMLCTEYALTAPRNVNTRDAIDEAATEAGVLEQLTVNGNDRDRIDELWDLLAAVVVPAGSYVWDGDATLIGGLNPARSNGDLTATVTLETGLLEGKEYYALPDGYLTAANNTLDISGDGEVTFAVTLPEAMADNDPGGYAYSNAFALEVSINSAGNSIIAVSILRKGDNTIDYGATANEGAQTIDLENQIAPAEVRFAFNSGAATCTIYVDDVILLADIPVAVSVIEPVALFMVGENIDAGGGSDVVATLSYDLPVIEYVAP